MIIINKNEIQFDDNSAVIRAEKINDDVLSVLNCKCEWKRDCQQRKRCLNSHLNSKMHVSVSEDDQEW